MSIKKSLKTTWWLFTANNDSPKSVALARIALVATPIILGGGVAISFAVALNLFVGIFMGLATAFLVSSSMLKSSRKTQDHVETYLKEDDQDILGTTSFVKMHERRSSTGHKLAFYQSWGEWMSIGHIPIDTFIKAVKEVDPLTATLDEDSLIDAVQYHYAQAYFSKTHNREGLRIVHKDTPDAFPITRLIAPDDLEPLKVS